MWWNVELSVGGTSGQNHVWPFQNFFNPLCLYLSEDTLKVVGPFYLVLMPGEEKDLIQGASLMSHCRSIHDMARSILLTTFLRLR